MELGWCDKNLRKMMRQFDEQLSSGNQFGKRSEVAACCAWPAKLLLARRWEWGWGLHNYLIFQAGAFCANGLSQPRCDLWTRKIPKCTRIDRLFFLISQARDPGPWSGVTFGSNGTRLRYLTIARGLVWFGSCSCCSTELFDKQKRLANKPMPDQRRSQQPALCLWAVPRRFQRYISSAQVCSALGELTAKYE